MIYSGYTDERDWVNCDLSPYWLTPAQRFEAEKQCSKCIYHDFSCKFDLEDSLVPWKICLFRKER